MIKTRAQPWLLARVQVHICIHVGCCHCACAACVAQHSPFNAASIPPTGPPDSLEARHSHALIALEVGQHDIHRLVPAAAGLAIRSPVAALLPHRVDSDLQHAARLPAYEAPLWGVWSPFVDEVPATGGCCVDQRLEVLAVGAHQVPGFPVACGGGELRYRRQHRARGGLSRGQLVLPETCSRASPLGGCMSYRARQSVTWKMHCV